MKSKLLVLSGISLFVALTQALPQKVAILGLDLSKNETMAGWFILAISSYFLISFIIFSALEIIQYYIPDLISKKTSKTTGDTIGLEIEECYSESESDDPDVGTPSGDAKEINAKNQKITYQYKNNFIMFSNLVKLVTEFAFPIVFGVISLYLLYQFLICTQ
ncbi:hypothetical protein FXV75_14220 [Marinomonas sp. IMCC 4694]|nr:hypothetical protein FXV75_14220 [Marinomonas sp. IMCC 4694]